MQQSCRYLYLHGFASNPRSRKGLRLRELFAEHAVDLELLDLNRPSFERLSYAAMLQALDSRLLAPGDARRACIIGSSMGGYLAARWAELCPDRVAGLVLLCPAFDMGRRWPRVFGDEAMTRWKNTGSLVLLDGDGEPKPVHYGLIEEGLRMPPYADVPCRTLIVHGTRDMTVPIDLSRAYAAARPNVELREVDDDHVLTASTDLIGGWALEFFGLASRERCV